MAHIPDPLKRGGRNGLPDIPIILSGRGYSTKPLARPAWIIIVMLNKKFKKY